MTRRFFPTRAALLALSLLAVAGCDGEPPPSALRIDEAWTRPTLTAGAEAGSTGAVYLTIRNGPMADTLVDARTAGAARIEFHESWDDGGIMRMRRLDAIPLAPGAVTHLQPGGMHLMLVGLTRDLAEGDTLHAVLAFRIAGPRDIAVPVVLR